MNSNFQFDRKKIKENPDEILDYLENLSSEVGILRTSISEQEARVSEQEARVSEQEARVSEQEARISELGQKNYEQEARISE
jgi:predicted  nucleic acid-binding Zn-ribbon protein